jgi:uncharacterized small protein (DUF1192 family)
MEEAMSDNSLIHDLECNHKATRYEVSIYSRARDEIDRLRAELAAAKQEHARLLQHATDSKLRLDDRTMAHRNEVSALLARIDRLRAELAATKEEARLAARALKGLGLIPDRKMEGQA